MFALDRVGDYVVFGARETLLLNGFSVETVTPQKFGGILREILVDLKCHAPISSGRATVPSRASSAA